MNGPATFPCEALGASLTMATCRENKAAGNVVPCLTCRPGACSICGRYRPLNAAGRCAQCRFTCPEPAELEPRPARPCPCCGRAV